jgi:hypothetical protein
MEHDSTQRLIVLSLSSLLALPVTSLPEEARKNVQSMFQQIIRELVLIEEQKEKDDNAVEGEEDDDDDDDFEGENHYHTLFSLCVVDASPLCHQHSHSPFLSHSDAH